MVRRQFKVPFFCFIKQKSPARSLTTFRSSPMAARKEVVITSSLTLRSPNAKSQTSQITNDSQDLMNGWDDNFGNYDPPEAAAYESHGQLAPEVIAVDCYIVRAEEMLAEARLSFSPIQKNQSRTSATSEHDNEQHENEEEADEHDNEQHENEEETDENQDNKAFVCSTPKEAIEADGSELNSSAGSTLKSTPPNGILTPI